MSKFKDGIVSVKGVEITQETTEYEFKDKILSQIADYKNNVSEHSATSWLKVIKLYDVDVENIKADIEVSFVYGNLLNVKVFFKYEDPEINEIDAHFKDSAFLEADFGSGAGVRTEGDTNGWSIIGYRNNENKINAAAMYLKDETSKKVQRYIVLKFK
jgi:hypothetical protein